MYCPQCGTAMHYAGKQPNFCHSCGHGFVSASTPEDEGTVKESPWSTNITKLDVDIETDDNKSYKLGEVVGTLDPDAKTNDDFIPAKPLTKREMLYSIKQESKTLREKK